MLPLPIFCRSPFPPASCLVVIFHFLGHERMATAVSSLLWCTMTQSYGKSMDVTRGYCFVLMIFNETCGIVIGCMSCKDNGSQSLQDNIRLAKLDSFAIGLVIVTGVASARWACWEKMADGELSVSIVSSMAPRASRLVRSIEGALGLFDVDNAVVD